jgi:hypothetical protein
MIMLRRLRIGHWLGVWVHFVCIILLLGTLLGAFLHWLIGSLFFESPEASYLFAMGAQNGFFYSGVWAGGLAIVLCFIRGHRENNCQRNQVEREDARP